MDRSSIAVALAVASAVAGCASMRASQPDVAAREVEYRAGDEVLRGHLALPAWARGPRPAVLVVHEWWGRTEHADRSAEEIAKLGWVGFAVDMYGDGRTTADPKQAAEWAGTVRKDPELAMRRVRAALDHLRTLPEADASRVACIGYCFGGTVALEAAWAALDLRAAVSFHGQPTTPRPEQVPGVKAAIVVCHGADDPLVAKETLDAFERSMRESRLDWTFASFGGAVHSFTNPAADGSFNPGVKYDERAASRSWEMMRIFLAERLR